MEPLKPFQTIWREFQRVLGGSEGKNVSIICTNYKLHLIIINNKVMHMCKQKVANGSLFFSEFS